MFLSKGYKGYYYLYYIDELTGKRKKISTKTKLKAEANQFLKLFNPDKKEQKKQPLIYLGQFQAEVMKYVINNLTKSSIHIYCSVFKNMVKVLGDKPIKHITFNDIELYKSERVKDVSKTSVNIELRTMKAAFNYALKSHYIADNPLRQVKPYSIPQKERLSFNKEEIDLVLSTITNKNIRNIVIFGLLTGCRLGEILNVQWKDINLIERILVIRNKPTFKTKSGKIREIPISDTLLKHLSNNSQQLNIIKLYEAEDYLFNKNGARYNKDYITRSFKRYLRIAGMDERYHFHCLRHTFLTQLATQGVSLYHLKEIAGHSDVKTTEVYLHTTTDDLRQAVNKMNLNL
jgi:integrase/recombinase XerD